MPDRDSNRHLAGPAHGGGADRRTRDEHASSLRDGPETRSFREARFEADDAHLNDELDRYDREHKGSGYPIDGSRFGFFALGQARQVQPEASYDLDPDYLHWRDQQMQHHDHDYADWRRHQKELYDDEYYRFRIERRDDFHERYQDWRARQDAANGSGPTAVPNPDDRL